MLIFHFAPPVKGGKSVGGSGADDFQNLSVREQIVLNLATQTILALAEQAAFQQQRLKNLSHVPFFLRCLRWPATYIKRAIGIFPIKKFANLKIDKYFDGRRNSFLLLRSQ